MKKTHLYCIFALLIIGVACQDKNSETLDQHQGVLNLSSEVFDYENYSRPLVYQGLVENTHSNERASNPVTNYGAQLGRVLFYDKALSKNNSISCASCHVQEFGFSDTAKFSRGFEGEATARHSMTLINAKYYEPGFFFWDERADSLEEQVLLPIQDHVEMGMTLDSLKAKLNQRPYYPALFRQAFGYDTVSIRGIQQALAQFVRSIVSSQSRYHKGLAQHHPDSSFRNFSEQENLGKAIFRGAKTINCSSCHFTPAFISDLPRNNGIRSNDFGAYFSRGEQTTYAGAFKVPSLINIAKRPPYMHDGSKANLMAVIEHYNSELNDDDGRLDPHLKVKNGEPFRMNLSQVEKEALLAFLLTLNDDDLDQNEAFSDPFRR